MAQSMWDVEGEYDGDNAGNGSGLVLGIDFGSSNSSVAVWRADKNRVKIIRNKSERAAKVTPSQLQFTEGFKSFKIGHECDEGVDNVISGLKAIIMGQDTSSVKDPTGWTDATTISCLDRPAGSGAQSKSIPVEELVGYMICYLKDCAETYLTRRPIRRVDRIDGSAVEETATPAAAAAEEGGATTGTSVVVNRVVMGVPANFTEHSKKLLRKAAQLAGFQEVHFFVESTAAAAAYGLAVAGRKTVLVVDMGGGTTDLSLVHIDNGAFTVRATGGSNDLGGRNIDAALLELVLEKAAALPDPEVAERVRAVPRALLLRLCRDCKERLSSEENATISIPNSCRASADGKGSAEGSTVPAADIVITREEFERCISTVTDCVQATVRYTVEQYLSSLDLSHSLSASPTEKAHSPAAGRDGEGGEEAEEEGFVTVHRESLAPSPSPADSAPSPGPAQTEGTIGAAIQEVVLVGGSSRVLAVRAAIRRAMGEAGIHHFGPSGAGELCTSLNPEEVVAEGLAIRGAVLSGVSAGKLRDLLVMDCLANALGVMSWEGPEGAEPDHSCTGAEQRVFDAVLRKGAPLPAEGKLRFRLAQPAQRFVSLDIYEEVEEVRLIKPTSQSSESGNGPSSSDTAGKGRYETAYSYHVVATVDVPVPVITSSTEDNTAVEVAFKMTTEGVLKFDVHRTNSTGQQVAESADVKRAEEFSTALLGMYGVLMVVLYALVKIAVACLHAEPGGSSSAGSGGGVEFEL